MLLGVLVSVATFFNPSTCADKLVFSSLVAAGTKASCFAKSVENARL